MLNIYIVVIYTVSNSESELSTELRPAVVPLSLCILDLSPYDSN